jgi:GNAT superfamily N-acetyltransferase
MIPPAPPLLAPGFHGVPAGHVAAVVTALEMRTRPDAPPRPDPPDVETRLVRDVDLAWYRALFRKVGARWLWTSRLTWSDETLRATLDDPAVEVHAVVPVGGVDSEAIGLLELDFRETAACEIAFFGLTPGWTGRGIGRWLMTRALARAWRTGVERVWVHTCTLDDPTALPFYLRSGFQAYARQVEILADPRLAGALSRSDAPQTPVIIALAK